jgi:ATP-dependent protease ClpP protease subunit
MERRLEILGLANGKIETNCPQFFLLQGHQQPRPFKIDLLNPKVRANPDNQSWVEAQESQLPSEILRRLHQFNVRISLVLHSLGGEAFVSDRFASIVSAINAQGGIVDTYGINIHSAAALLWLTGNRRFCLEDSSILLHAREVLESDSEETPRELLEICEQKSAQDKERIEDLVLSFPGKTHRHTFLSRASLDPRSTIVLSGKTAEVVGLADKAFRTTAELMSALQRNLGTEYAEGVQKVLSVF